MPSVTFITTQHWKLLKLSSRIEWMTHSNNSLLFTQKGKKNTIVVYLVKSQRHNYKWKKPTQWSHATSFHLTEIKEQPKLILKSFGSVSFWGGVCDIDCEES